MENSSNKIVIARVFGGLGNQLFQYAYGLHLSRVLGARLFCDLSAFGSNPAEMRSYMLGRFQLPVEECRGEDLRPLTWAGKNRVGLAACKRLLKISGGRYRYLRERDHTDLNSLQIARWIYLDGHWQRHDYLDQQRQDFLQIVRPRDPLPKFEKNGAVETVGVHVRRGDYIPLGCDLPAEYYSRAFAALQQRIGKEVLPVIFSDDLEWAAENLSLSPRQIVRKPETPVADFWHFGQCDHQIISNSTFSWWGAWLNKNPSKVVVAPRDWRRESTFEVQQLVPRDWELI